MTIEERCRLGAAAATILLGLAVAMTPFGTRDAKDDGVGGASALLTRLRDRIVAGSAAIPARPAPRSLTVIAAGDVLLHQGLWSQARDDAKGGGFDFRPIFAGVKPVISGADLAVCHMETPLGKPGGPFTGFPTFNVPPQVVPALADLGYDTCSTASNHSLDGGQPGIKRTLDALDRAGIAHTGTARDPAERVKINLMLIKGVRVAQLSYTFSFNGIQRPDGRPWVANPLDPRTVLRDARRARMAGAEIVIVSIHWGTEYQHQPDSRQRAVAGALLASPDIDLILGHHAHVVQPFEKIGQKWVVYRMGNFVSTQTQSQTTRDGVLPRFTFTEVSPGHFAVAKAEALPIYMSLNGRPFRVMLVADCAHRGGHMAECAASGRRTAKVVRSRGAAPLILV